MTCSQENGFAVKKRIYLKREKWVTVKIFMLRNVEKRNVESKNIKQRRKIHAVIDFSDKYDFVLLNKISDKI